MFLFFFLFAVLTQLSVLFFVKKFSWKRQQKQITQEFLRQIDLIENENMAFRKEISLLVGEKEILNQEHLKDLQQIQYLESLI